MGIFVPDGYTEERFINSADKLWPDDTYKVSFRPPVGFELDRFLTGQITNTEFLAEKIVSWNVKDDQGNILKIEPATFMKLHGTFCTRLLAVVAGWAKNPDGTTLSDERNLSQKN